MFDSHAIVLLEVGAATPAARSWLPLLKSTTTSAVVHAAAISLLALVIYQGNVEGPPEAPLVASLVEKEIPLEVARLETPELALTVGGGNQAEGQGQGAGMAAIATSSQVVFSPTVEAPTIIDASHGQSTGFGIPGEFADHLGDSPSARGVSFFGVTASGTNFVFVVDMSGSMSEGNRMRRTMNELQRAISSLAEDQRFYVVFFNHEAHPMPSSHLLEATDINQRAAQKWIKQVHPMGHTDPRLSLQIALDLKPDAIFLMSDGEFHLDVDRDLYQDPENPVPIHTIAFVSRLGEPVMREVSARTNGKFRFEP